MFRALSVVIVVLCSSVASAYAVDRKDLCKYDCNGSPTTKLEIAPGVHEVMWHGSCAGEEGHDVVVTTKARKTDLSHSWKAEGKNGIVLRFENHTNHAISVAVHVMVGFA